MTRGLRLRSPDLRAQRLPEVSGELIERIEQVATQLFIRHGYRGVSYLSIAKELGIAHSSVHYYYRNKSALAEAVLRRVAAQTLATTSRIWRDPDNTLLQKFVHMRDWVYDSYLQYNPDGKSGRPWGLLSRFSMDADALTSEMRQVIRETLRKQESDILHAVHQARNKGEFRQDAPVEGIGLQILSVIHMTGQLTRYSAGFMRLDELMRRTIETLYRAYGQVDGSLEWPRTGGHRTVSTPRRVQ